MDAIKAIQKYYRKRKTINDKLGVNINQNDYFDPTIQ